MSTFTTLSDLVADADDLILSIGKLADPRMQALKLKVEASIADVKRQARARIRRELATSRAAQRAVPRFLDFIPALAVAAGLTLALLRRREPRGRAATRP